MQPGNTILISFNQISLMSMFSTSFLELGGDGGDVCSGSRCGVKTAIFNSPPSSPRQSWKVPQTLMSPKR
jgi:hypothetical protein